MATITDRLNRIKNAKESIKSSIEAKGVEVGDVSIEEYSSKIDELKTVNFKINNGNHLFRSGAREEIVQELLALCEDIQGAERMFYYCEFTDLDLSGLDGSNIKTISSMLYGCTNLINLTFMENVGKGFTQTTKNFSNYTLDLSSCTKLTYDSLMSVINNLYDLNLTYDVANGGTLYTQQLVLGSTNLAKLTPEEIRNSDCKTVGLFHRKEKIMEFIPHTTPKMIISAEGKHIRAKNDVYYKDEDGEHYPHYSTVIFVPNTFTKEQMHELYVEEEIKN